MRLEGRSPIDLFLAGLRFQEGRSVIAPPHLRFLQLKSALLARASS